jgi:hypothetical protein
MKTWPKQLCLDVVRTMTSAGRRLHVDQRGAMSIISVFTLLLLTMVLGLVMNSAREIDHKVKLQNAADAATWTGGLVLVRSLNTLAFTNHLLCDVFALTAFMREADENHSEQSAQEILEHWERIGPFLATSEFPPFAELGNAIVAKVPIEQQMVKKWSQWARVSSSAIRPVLESILQNEAIPEFQRTLAIATPTLTQRAMDEVARRHGQGWPERIALHGVLWRTIADPVGGTQESVVPSLPAVDPVSTPDPRYFRAARSERDFLAHRYLRQWNNERLREFDGVNGEIGQHGKMSQFANLWRIFSCGQLRVLLEEEYPDRNLTYQLRWIDSGNLSYQIRRQDGIPPQRIPVDQPDLDQYLERDFMFVGVVYAPPWRQMMPGLFRSPTAGPALSNSAGQAFPIPRTSAPNGGTTAGGAGQASGALAQAYSQILVSVPRRRLVPDPIWLARRQSSSYHAMHWDLTNQNWNLQLTAATAPTIPEILSTHPGNVPLQGQLPNLRGLTPQDLHWISNH